MTTAPKYDKALYINSPEQRDVKQVGTVQAKAFFLHIPRTAGTTINAVLEDNYAEDEILSFYAQEDYQIHASHSAETLARIRLIQGHILLPDFDPPSIFGLPVQAFTFVREPLARIASEYHFLRSWEHNHMFAYLHEHKVSLKDYVLSEERLLRYRGRNFMTRIIAGMDVGLDPLPRKALARAKRHLEHAFCFVGIQERFLESLVLLGEVLGLTSLLHEKRNALRKTDTAIATAEEEALMQELNQGDSALYHFACQLFEERVAAQGALFTQKVRQLTELNAKYQKICDSLGQRVAGELSPTRLEGRPISLPKEGLW